MEHLESVVLLKKPPQYTEGWMMRLIVKKYPIPGTCIFFVGFPTRRRGYLFVEYNGTWTFQLIRVTSFLIVFLPHCIRSLCTRTINGIYWLDKYFFYVKQVLCLMCVCEHARRASFEDMMRAVAICIEMTLDCTIHWRNYRIVFLLVSHLLPLSPRRFFASKFITFWMKL